MTELKFDVNSVVCIDTSKVDDGLTAWINREFQDGVFTVIHTYLKYENGNRYRMITKFEPKPVGSSNGFMFQGSSANHEFNIPNDKPNDFYCWNIEPRYLKEGLTGICLKCIHGCKVDKHESCVFHEVEE